MKNKQTEQGEIIVKNRTLFIAMTSLVASVLIASVAIGQEKSTPACTYTLTPLNQFVAANHGPGNFLVKVVTQSGCLWTAVSNAPWITVTYGGVGVGLDWVKYSVANNPGPNARRGTMTIAGKTFKVSQASPVPPPCTILIPLGATVGWRHWTNHRFSIDAEPGTCPWSVQTLAPWITLRSNPSGTGRILFVYEVEENTDPEPRVGRILVNGKSFLVTQESQ